MKIFGKNIAPGISLKVSLGLGLIILVAFISNTVAKRYFDKSALMFQTISEEQLPLLIVASKLAKEVEGLTSEGSGLALTVNPLLLETLSQDIVAHVQKIQDLVSELQEKHVEMAPYLSRKIQQIFENLGDLANLIKEDIDVYQRLLQISIHMRRTSEALTVGIEPLEAEPARRTRELFLQIFSLLRDVPNILDSQRLEEYQSQIFELENMIDGALEEGHFETASFDHYLNTLKRYGSGEKGLLALAGTHLLRKTLIQDKLVQITFLSDDLVKQTERIFSDVSAGIQQQSKNVTKEIDWVGKLFLLIPVVIVFSAGLIFLFIRRSVIGRILALEQSMKAHVDGNPLPISANGDDEIASMARSVSYFVEKRNEYETTLKDARLAAERANRAKSIFLASMSHELRTPLNAILGFSQLLTRSETLSSREAEYLSTIRRSGEHLLSLINQILDLSTIEAGRLVLNEHDFDFHALLDEIENMFRIRVVNNQPTLVFERSRTVPRIIKTDPLKLRQVLINLLGNAFKFTKKGSITLRVTARKKNGGLLEEADASLGLFFEVQDTGTGIDPDELGKIFDAFEQTRTGRLAKEGTGLGLTISRGFVELMGGHLSVKSEAGKGSLFTFDICVKVVSSKPSEIYEALEKHLGVRWVYENDPIAECGPASDGPDDWPGEMSSLAPKMQEELKYAVSRADMEAIDQSIEQIGKHAPRLAEKLREWAHDFEYESILSLMKGAQKE